MSLKNLLMTMMKIRNKLMTGSNIQVKNINSHFSELRKRIIFSLIFYLIATIFGFVFHRNILSLMVQPVTEINQLSQGLPVFTNITEFWSVVMKVSLLSGLLLSFPLISYQVLAFILPGLKRNEKKFRSKNQIRKNRGRWHALLAQWIARWTSNPEVAGSNPVMDTR